jgi:uncharacterized membrane protein
MSQFVVATFPNETMAIEANRLVNELRGTGMTVYGWAVLGKDIEGKISVLHRVADSSHATAVAALIGALAGLPAGPLGAVMGAVGGGLIGISADLTDRGAGRSLAEKVSQALAAGNGAVIADVSSEARLPFETGMKDLGGTVLHTARRVG